jgi:UDP-N-acetylglucosamine--N-acetylmuramyl-(pentapeptide) pyrophosphoryl-undecaprenol N-acetylglucosamine transferase
MKILLVGGGTGGHFYPLIAIAEELNKIADQEKLLNYKLYYMGETEYDKDALKKEFITFIPITAGKMRVYFSLKNITDFFKTLTGIIQAFFKLYSLYPDVIISKGGYSAFPVLVAARFFRIPVIIHESDSAPGRVNKWSGKFAARVALTYPEAASYFDSKKISLTGQPVRKIIAQRATEGGAEFFDLDPNVPIIGILGGSLGAKVINNVVVQLVPTLLDRYQIIHQTGKSNFEDVTTDAKVLLGDSTKRNHYKVFSTLNELEMKMFSGAVSLVITRAGSTLNEIAAWGVPSIVIPGSPEVYHDDHQRKNAYHYARTGACAVIEEQNLTASVLLNEIDLILTHKDRYNAMSEHARAFYQPDAGRKIATEAIKIALEHEK